MNIAAAARLRRFTADRLLLWGLALFVAAAMAIPAHAASESIQSVIVKFRDDALPSRSSALPADLQSALLLSLGTQFSVTGRTPDGAVALTLTTPMSYVETRAAINRVRASGRVIYASILNNQPNMVAKNAEASTAPPPVRQMVVKYRDAAITEAALRNEPPPSSSVERAATVAGQPVAAVRAMTGGAYVLRLFQPLPDADAEALARALESDPEVEFAAPDRIKTIQISPNDTCYASAGGPACNGAFQWDLFEAVGGANLPGAWDITTGSTSIVVGVLDTGILAHPDLSGRTVPGYDMIVDTAVANDGNGRDADPSDPGDWVVANECYNGSGASNSSWHGTHVSGTIGAATNNASNIAGINWVSKILPVRVLGKCGGYTSDIMDAMTWAAGLSVPGVPSNPNPAKVVNLSLGGGGACDAVFEQPIINNVIAAGTTVVIAAGNSNGDAANFSPGNCNGVITVAATQRAGARASYSNYGTTVEIAAPGGGDGNYILSTLNSGATVPAAYVLALYQGTSMATPHVAGIVSLMLSANPALTPAQVLSKVQSTARAFPTGTARDCTANPAAVNATVKYCGAGIIDAQAAVLSAGGGGGGPVATTTAVASSLNPAGPGASVTFTATVTGKAPTGTVNFRDAGVTFGGCGAVAFTGGAGDVRTAQCTTSGLAAGAHSITAVYSGDAGNLTSTSPVLTQSIGVPTSSTALTSSPNPAAPGVLVTFTATVTGSTPTGTVNFKDGGVTFGGCGAVAFTGGSGNVRTAKCTTSSLPAGTHMIVATFSGDAGNVGSSSPTLYQFIFGSGPAASSTALASSQNPAPTGASVTFTATVTGKAPTGTVNFKDGGVTFGGCGAVAFTGGVGDVRTAQCTTSALAAGTHSLVATYSGNAGNQTSSSPTLSQVISSGPVATTTALASSLNPAPAGQSVTFTATVTGTAPTGTVNFMDGGVTFGGCGAVAFTGGAGDVRTAQCTTSALAVGTHNLTAAYSGNAGNQPSTSSPALAQVITGGGLPPAATTVKSYMNPARMGLPVVLSATVTGIAPSGTVNFKDGAVSIPGCAAVPLSGAGNMRSVTCVAYALTVGTHSIVAAYSGDGSNGAASSAPLSQVITP